MPSPLKRFLSSQHHRHPVRQAIWHTLARVGATGMHTLPVSRRWVDIHRRPMPLSGLSPDLAGLRLVHISDLHYSPVVWRDYLEQYVAFINELRPELVVITGDLITGGYRYAGKVARIIRQLEAPFGVVCTFGNHDYSMWGKHPAQGQRRGDYLEQSLEAEGLVVLRNETLRVTRQGARQYRQGEPIPAGGKDGALLIVGLDDEWTGRIDPARAFAGIAPSAAAVCLNHNPANARELIKYPWQWMLSGHTHGRQIGHKGLSKAFLAHKIRHFTHGYYAVEGRHLYVNRGLSYGQRTHQWCRPEVTLFKITPA